MNIKNYFLLIICVFILFLNGCSLNDANNTMDNISQKYNEAKDNVTDLVESIPAPASDFKTKEVDDNSVKITKYKGNNQKVVVPSTIKGKEADFREDTHHAIRALEETAGKKILSFRAPAFSIGESNKWAIEILASEGIVNDASIFPGIRDFGGFPSFSLQDPCIIERNNQQLIEFPIPLVKMPITGKEIAYSGGGYFRLLPLSFIRHCTG